MPLWLPGNRLVLPKRDYSRRVLATRPYSLVAYWPLDDLVGSTARNLAEQQAQLVVNGGFEVYTGTQDDGLADTFTGWTVQGTGTGKVEATATVHGGSNATMVTAPGSAPWNRQMFADFNVVSGRVYSLSFWCRGDGTNAGRYNIYDVTNSTNITGATSTGVTGTIYTQVTTTFTAPATCMKARVYVQCAEAADAAVYFDDVTVSRDLGGAYTGVALTDRLGPFNRPVPFFDGSGDYVNIYTAPLASEFSGAEGTMAGWVRVNSIADWTDGTQRCLATIYVNATNRLYLAKSPTNNQWILTYVAGGTTSTVSVASGSALGWTHLALTWSAAADEMKGYVNGVQISTTQTLLGTWAGTPGSTTTVIGAYDTSPALVWNGWLGDVALWKAPLTQAEIAPLGRRR